MNFVVPGIRVRQKPQFFIKKKLCSDYLIFKEPSFSEKSKLFDYNKTQEKVNQIFSLYSNTSFQIAHII